MTDSVSRDPAAGATVSDLTERQLIARIRARLPAPPPWLLVGIGDDAAVVEPERNRLEVLSVDAVVDGVHFDRAFVPARAIGHRALAVNLSDLAAMGAAARFALLSMALPSDLPVEAFDGITDGLTALAAAHRLHVVGGNLTRTPGPLALDITVSGTVKPRRALTRSGARPGDELYVTGAIGAAHAGLGQLKAARDAGRSADAAAEGRLARAYLYPEPRLRAGMMLGRGRVASACMDLSDGLADAVLQVAEASGVGAEIEAEALPIDAEARCWFEAIGGRPLERAVTGGDDFVLLVAIPPRRRRQVAQIARLAGVPLSRIGACVEGAAVTLDGAPLPRGYSHFG
jgi:thiamine-monophosphate kinase